MMGLSDSQLWFLLKRFMFSISKGILIGSFLMMACWIIGFQRRQIPSSLVLPNGQSGCVEQVIGKEEILASQMIDVDQNGEADQVVLYINSSDARIYDPIYVLVILNSPTHCEVVLNAELTPSTLTTGRQAITVRRIEMVELTGDNKPELHIWLERRNGGPRASVAYHAVFAFVDGRWKHVLGDKGVEQCLVFSSFEFRDSSAGNAKDIYLDEDRLCNPPWSSHRNYSILRWNGAEFATIESGIINIPTMYPTWMKVCCVVALVSSMVVLIPIVSLLRKRRDVFALWRE